MSRLLLKNIRILAGVHGHGPPVLKGPAMREVPVIEEAWLACDSGRIADFGHMGEFPGISDWHGLEVIDCTGRIVMPAFADSHTHLVYAGNREKEFADRISGLSYEEIARRGGGILNSVDLLRKTSEEDLFLQAKGRFLEIIAQGTGAVEIKSGYGLDIESELKMLRVIRRLKDLSVIPVKATFLGAHAVPREFAGNADGYVHKLIDEMIPAIASEGVADFIDVFCERNYFDAATTQRILEAGAKHGLRGKVHAEQLSHTGGIAAGVRAGAISVDHLEFCSDEDILMLKDSDTMPTILPGAAFFLGLQFPPVRKMIDAGLPVALASDFNPGSSPSGNMKLMMSIACIQYRMTTEEAFNAATFNSAYAMGIQEEVGSITPGKLANLIVTCELPSLHSLAYEFGSDHVHKMIVNGKPFSVPAV